MDAISLHRAAHRAYERGIPIVPRLIDYLIFLLFNSVIHHTSRIGERTRCAYRGMSVLIHQDAVIGNDVTIGPHVVIGGRSGQRPPIIGNRVYLGANVTVLGGITLGDDAVVGGGSVVLHDVAPGEVVAGNPARPIRRPASA